MTGVTGVLIGVLDVTGASPGSDCIVTLKALLLLLLVVTLLPAVACENVRMGA